MPRAKDTSRANHPRRLKIDDINIAAAVQIRTRLNQDAIAQYTDIFDELPPVDVYDVQRHGLVLADGWHRLEAAKRLNRDSVLAVVRKGTLQDAMAWAVTANVKHGQPLTRQERYDAVLRLKRLHKGWTNTQVAKAVGLSMSTVSYMIREAEVRAEVGPSTKKRQMLRYIGTLPKKHWEPLIAATEKRGWSSDEVRIVVQNMKSKRVPQEYKDALLTGEVDPVVEGHNHEEPGFLPVTVARMIRKEVANDTTVALLRAEEALARLATFEIYKVVESLDRDHAQRVLREYPKFIATLEGIYNEIGARVPLKEVQ